MVIHEQPTIFMPRKGEYENQLFWGEVRMQSITPPVFRNCAFAGKDPATYTTLTGVIKDYGTGYHQFEMYDSVIDPGLWRDTTVARPGNAPITDLITWRRKLAASAGVHGGRATLVRVEITNVQDGVNWVQTKLDVNDASFTKLEGCWLHKNVYYHGDDWTATPDGSHSDSFQTNTGSNLTLRGNLFGGHRDEGGYSSWPAYNSGDDAWNSGLMLKQEVDNADLRRIENVLIEKNFFWNGFSGINHAYTASRPNLFTTTKIRDNYFIRRDGAAGYYIIRSSNFASCFSGNKLVDLTSNGGFTTVSDVHITNG